MSAKKRWGDRRDATMVRDLDSLHVIMPLVYLNRTDNEAFISERINCEPIMEWVARKNAENPELPYTMFHVIVAAMFKCLTLRPKMNRFITNKTMYQRDEMTAAFVVKKQFNDHAGEGMAFIHGAPEDTVETIHEKIRAQVQVCRSDKGDATSEQMDIITKLPRFLLRFALWIIRFLDRHGWCPQFLIETDANYASVMLSNLGSIKLQAGYHHLSNWGTTSFFCTVGERKMRPVYNPDGTSELHLTVDLGLTIDERIADGYYYSGTMRLLRKILEHPELLERPFSEEVDY